MTQSGNDRGDLFSDALAITLPHEGGFVNHPDDPGGATNMGITRATLAAWRGGPVSVADMRALTEAEAAAIYRARYWSAVHGDALPAGVGAVVFDFGVNAGTGRAIRLLQATVGAVADGIIGPKTLAAVRALPPGTVIEEFSWGRLEHYCSLGIFRSFGRGWVRRTTQVRKAGLALTAGSRAGA